MLTQIVKFWQLLFSLVFTIMAIINYFSGDKIYPVLISVAFIIYLIGEIAVFVLNYQFDRRKFDFGIDQREYDRLMIRQTD